MVRAGMPRPPGRWRARRERPLPLDHRRGHAGDRRLRPGAVGRPPPPPRRRPGRRWSPSSTPSDAPTWRSGSDSAPRTARASACTASVARRATTSPSAWPPATIGSISTRRGGRSRPFAPAGADRAGQPSAWLNWPQIADGSQASGSPRIEPRRPPGFGPPERGQALEARLVLGQKPGPHATGRAACDAPGVEDRLGVLDPRRDRRTAAPRSADDEPTERAVVAVQDPRRCPVPRRHGAGAPGPRRWPRRRGRPSRPGPRARNGRTRGSAAAPSRPSIWRIRYQVWTSNPSRS